MLKLFSVRNFKGFNNELVLDLSDSNRYEFNGDAMRQGIVNKAIIYGQNGCGKSNLGLALFDLILHLTDKEKLFGNYPVYLNYNSTERFASFKYVFEFDGQAIEYSYTKYDFQVLRTERLIIRDRIVLDYDFDQDKGFCLLDGTQSLKMNSPDSKLSKLKFIRNNAILANNEENRLFETTMTFIEKMLLFYSLMHRGYQGFLLGTESIEDAIVRFGKLSEFESFLHKAGITETLEAHEINGKNEIGFQYKNGIIPLQLAASTGTKSLELFFYWYMQIDNTSFVFMDEFDAFYHYELSEMLVRELLAKKDVQVILTTHNTDLLSNDLLRPDCYFIMENNEIKSLSNLTRKELRKAHNIQKMYKAGAFNDR